MTCSDDGSSDYVDQLTRDFLRAQGVPEGSAPTLWMPPPAEPITGAPVVHLDTKDWINLAKARQGRPDGERYRPSYEWLLEHTASGRVVVVLSSALYVELSTAIGGERQRVDLADVMSEITRFRTLNSRHKFLERDFERQLHHKVGRPGFPVQVPSVGLGCYFAFSGVEARPRLGGLEEEALARYYAMPGMNTLLTRAGEIVEWFLLRGVTPEQGAEIPGYSTTEFMDIERQRVERENEFATLLKSEPKNKRDLDKIVLARELYADLAPELPRLLARAGMTAESFFSRGPGWLIDFVEGLPAILVQTALRHQHHANATRKWKSNDLRDVDQLSTAVPYCDVVVTEKHSIDALKRRKLDEKCGTTLLASVDQLPGSLGSRLPDASSGRSD